LVTGAIL